MSNSHTRRRVSTLRLIVIALVAALLTGVGMAEAKEVNEGKPRSEWPAKFDKNYHKAKRQMEFCHWKPAWDRLFPIRKNLIKYRGWHGARDLAVAAYSYGFKRNKPAWRKRGQGWARYAISIAPYFSNHIDADDVAPIRDGDYRPAYGGLCH